MNLWIPFCAFLYFLIPFWSAGNHMIFHKGPIKPKMAKGHWHIGNWAAKSLLFFGVKVFWESSSISYCSNSYQPYCPSTETAVSKNLQVTFRILHSSSQHLMFFWVAPVISCQHSMVRELRQAKRWTAGEKSAFAPSRACHLAALRPRSPW